MSRILTNFSAASGCSLAAIEVELSDAELAERKKAWKPRLNDYRSGALWKYAQLVGDAEKGAVTNAGARAEVKCYADI